MPYTNYVVQEFDTDSPKEGFEHVVGYTGSQEFYWNQVTASRSYKLKVLNEMQITPESKLGLLENVDILRNIPWDSEKRNSLFLVLAYPNSDEALTTISHDLDSTVSDFTSALVNEAKERGVTLAPKGTVLIHSIDHGSINYTLRKWSVRVLSLSLFSAIATALALMKYRPNQAVDTTAVSAPR